MTPLPSVFSSTPANWLPALVAAAMPAPAASPGPDTPADDRRQMELLVAGDSHALRPLFDRWKLPLISYFYRALGSRADAEDLTLQTFTQVYRHAARYRPETVFSTWLFGIARHELLHELRRRRRKPVEPVSPAELDFAPHGNPPGDERHLAELEEQLLAALQHLPERERSALLLTAAGELTRPQIATTLQVTENHLGVILHRARETLRRHFQPSR